MLLDLGPYSCEGGGPGAQPGGAEHPSKNFGEVNCFITFFWIFSQKASNLKSPLRVRGLVSTQGPPRIYHPFIQIKLNPPPPPFEKFLPSPLGQPPTSRVWTSIQLSVW